MLRGGNERIMNDNEVMEPGWYLADGNAVDSRWQGITVAEYKGITGCLEVAVCDVKRRGLE